MVQNEYWPRLFHRRIKDFVENKDDFARKYYQEKLQEMLVELEMSN